MKLPQISFGFGTMKNKKKKGFSINTFKNSKKPFSTVKESRSSKLKTSLKGTSLKKFRKMEKKPGAQYLSREEIEHAAITDPITRKRILSKADRMARDPVYRAKILSKSEEKKGRYEGRFARAQRLSKQRMKAATSPWWKLWYTLSNNIMYILGVLLIIASVFIPVGLFYIAGWALAVGLASLIMFIVWVFMETWFFISQGLVTVINLIGQTFNGIINFIGGSLGNTIGYEFNPFDQILVQNMPLNEGGTWGSQNLIPPSFLNLDKFMPLTFDTDTILAKIFPPISSFFHLIYNPIAQRYLDWIATAEWWYIGAIVGVPLLLVLVGVVGVVYYFKRRVI